MGKRTRIILYALSLVTMLAMVTLNFHSKCHRYSTVI